MNSTEFFRNKYTVYLFILDSIYQAYLRVSYHLSNLHHFVFKTNSQ